MKNKLLKGALICVLTVCVYLMGSHSVLASAAEQISVWTTSLQYDLEITEPSLEKNADGSGRFSAVAVCSERVYGTEIRVAVVFYDSTGKMLDCWEDSFILNSCNEIAVCGTVPEYTSLGVYFFEDESLKPIKPSVLSSMEQQTTDGDISEIVAELEKRIRAQEEALSELSEDVALLEESFENQGYIFKEQKEFFNSGWITGTEGIGTIDMNGFGFIIFKEWLTEYVSGVKVNLYINGKTNMPVTCEVLNSSRETVSGLTVTDIISADGEHIFDISFGPDDIEEDYFYLAIYNADRKNGHWLGFSTIDTSSEWYQATSASGIQPIYLYGTRENWVVPNSYPKRYFALLYDEIFAVEPEDVATKEFVEEKLSEFSTNPEYNIIQTSDEYYAVEGDTLEIFYKSILNAKNPLNYNIHASCSIGTSFQEKFVVPPTAEAGLYPLTLTITNDKGELIDRKTININVQKKAASPDETINVLCMGASTVQDGIWVNELYRRLTQTSSVAVTGDPGPSGDGLSNISFIGNRKTNLGAGYEGFGGWSWKKYTDTSSDENPFCYNGELDFSAYCEDIGASGIDYVYAQLVYNDTPNGTSVSEDSLEKKASQIRIFLNALLEDYPDAKLVLVNSPVPSYDGCGTNYTAASVFQNSQYIKDWMYKHQSVIYPMLKAEFPDNIYFCDYSAQFDIDHGYPSVTVAYNTRTSQTYQRQSNGVHPTNEGKMQCSDAVYRHFTYMLNETAGGSDMDEGGDDDSSGQGSKIGDVNLDGVINVKDVYFVRLVAAKLVVPSESQFSLSDVDLDGRVTAIDANFIRRFAAKIIDSLPVQK